jgi:hypothetical protein
MGVLKTDGWSVELSRRVGEADRLVKDLRQLQLTELRYDMALVCHICEEEALLTSLGMIQVLTDGLFNGGRQIENLKR